MGLFWDDNEFDKKRQARLRALPPIPSHIKWERPANPPDLSGIQRLAFDVEAYDPHIDELGPGWARKDGYVCGFSLAALDRLGNKGAWYFPLRHTVGGEYNYPDPDAVLRWLKPQLATTVPKVNANITYDIGWLTTEEIEVIGELHDVQFAEALLDHEALVALENLSWKYLNRGKGTDELLKWQRAAYPNTPETKRRGDIYRTPPPLVGFYGEQDAMNPLDILPLQLEEIRKQGLEYVYRMECDLIPLFVHMRLQGVAVDYAAAEQARETLGMGIKDRYSNIYHKYGFNIDTTKASVIGPILEHLGIKVGRNPNGSYSIRKEWLTEIEHPISDEINEIRELEKMKGTFIEGYILNKASPIPGSNSLAKIYPTFHQLKSERGGTFVGRIASSDPNLQNIPGRTEEGKKVRQAFVADYGHEAWLKMDFSQIHYRLLAHYAVGPGSDELRARYINDPKTDYHQDVYNRVAPKRGWSMTDQKEIKGHRRIIKNINFSGLYGVSKKTLKYKYLPGMGDAEVEQFLKDYYEANPYIKPTMEAVEREMQNDGFVSTILGRRVRFNLWEPIRNKDRKMPLPYGQAINEWGAGIKRAYGYRAINYKFQGSEPDIMKHGMRECWQSGVFKVLPPRVTVHDELGFSKPDSSPQTLEAIAFIKRTLENSVKLRIPIFVDIGEAESWGLID